MPAFRVTSKTFEQAYEAASVTSAVEARARRVLASARQAAYAAGRGNFGDALRLDTGRRPGTKSPLGIRRPYARIIAATTEAQNIEDSRTAKLSRTKILRRAARG